MAMEDWVHASTKKTRNTLDAVRKNGGRILRGDFPRVCGGHNPYNLAAYLIKKGMLKREHVIEVKQTLLLRLEQEFHYIVLTDEGLAELKRFAKKDGRRL